MADLHAVAVQAARKAGIDPNIFVRQINQESGFNPTARSGAGAVGIAQIVPRWHPGVNPLDPVASLNYAANWMGQLVRKYGGSYEKALSVYNSGKPDAYQNPGFAGGQTYHYVRSILGGAGAGGPTAAVGPVAAPPAAAPTLPSLSAPPGAPAAPLPRGLPSPLLAAVNTGNEMFGLPQLPAQLLSAVAPAAAPTLSTAAPSVGRVLPAPSPDAGRGAAIGGIAKTALTQIGIPYQWGGQAKLGGRTDCSGLLQASARANGINIGRTTYEQWKQGTAVPLNALKPGDAVFFHPGPKGPEHVAIYIGGGRIVEDPQTGESVHISALAGRGPMGARRY